MPKVNTFPRLPALTPTSILPVAQRSASDPPENLSIRMEQVETYLEGRGFAKAVESDGSSSVLQKYFLRQGAYRTDIMYIGYGDILSVSNMDNGELTVEVPPSAQGAIAIPNEFLGRRGDDSVVVHLQHSTEEPFFLSEATLFPPRSVQVYDRSTEEYAGEDVLLEGNNPQKRILPFTDPGRVSVAIAGMPERYMIVITLP